MIVVAVPIRGFEWKDYFAAPGEAEPFVAESWTREVAPEVMKTLTTFVPANFEGNKAGDEYGGRRCRKRLGTFWN